MYLPSSFEEARSDVLSEWIRADPFALLTLNGAEGPIVNQIPLHWSPAASPEAGSFGVLRGHAARGNAEWKQLRGVEPGDSIVLVPAVAVFSGPHAYVSPSWYPSKKVAGKAVPTWNYVTVHARGTLRLVDDATWLRDHLAALTQVHEGGFDEPWSIDDAPADYIDSMIRGVVGLELTVTSLVGKCKASQNRSAEDRRSVIDHLERGDASQRAMAEVMARALGQAR
ncbi:MAG: FMN-binding negative transcriptional regulator [Rhizobacter sp.]|nr:FMN-binding negative transcriptional regulator [Rhizobacter sp.]